MKKLTSQLYDRIAVLESALRSVAERLEDAATVMREQRADYYNPGYYDMTARRCRNVLNGGHFHDEPPRTESTKCTSPRTNVL